MIKIIVCSFLLCIVSVKGQTAWASRACLVGHRLYYAKIMQEMFTQIEKDIKWCNMKMIDLSQRVNERLFKWHATGTVNYTDGFVVSVEKIDLTNMQGWVSTTTVNGTQQRTHTVQGNVNLRELKIGFNVVADLDDSGTHRSTGEYAYLVVTFMTSITWNSSTKELTTGASVSSTSGGHRRMAYRPSSNITEMLSRGFTASSNGNSFRDWGREHFAPRMLKIASTMDFPTVRFDGRC